MYDIIFFFFYPLALTLFLETIVYFFLKPFNYRLISVTIILNIILNISLNLVLYTYFPTLPRHLYGPYLVILELVIFMIETVVVYVVIKEKLLKTALFALLANGLSVSVGLLLNTLYMDKANDSIVIIITLSLLCGVGIFIGLTFLIAQFQKENN